MKKSFIPLAAFALLALVSCSGNTDTSSTTPSSEPESSSNSSSSSSSSSSESSQFVANSVSITNKTDLTADWYLGSGDRTLNLTIDPTGNVNQLINDGTITITSSNTAVVAVNGRVLQAKSVGESTITVTYGGKTDTVDVAVKAEQTAIDLYGTVHAGTLEDPLDNADAVKVAEATGTTATSKYFYVKGEVASWKDAPSNYGNVSYYLKKADTDKTAFMIYRAVLDKETFGTDKVTDKDIWIGATVTAKVKIVNYNSDTPETSSGGYIVKVEGVAPKTIDSNVADALTAAKGLKAGETSFDKYVVTGYIVGTDDSNGFYLTDDKTVTDVSNNNCLYIYQYLSENTIKCANNAKVKITGVLEHYTNDKGTNDSYRLSSIKDFEVIEAGDAVNSKTFSETLTAAKALSNGKTSSAQYAFEGVITDITTGYSSNSMSYTVADAAGGEDTLTVYKTYVDLGENAASDFVVGAKVKVTGNLYNYYNSSSKNSTYEVVKGTTSLVEKATDTKQTTNVADALKAAKALASYEYTTNTYEVTGYVTSIKTEYSTKYGNMSVYLSDDLDDPNAAFLGYQVKCDEETSKKIIAGAKVKVTGKLVNYNGTYETIGSGKATIEFVEEAATAVTATIAESSIKVGATSQITATAGDKDTFTYSSNNTAVATVDTNGLVTGKAMGNARIEIASSNGRKAYVNVAVNSETSVTSTVLTAVEGKIEQTGYTYKAEKGKASTEPAIHNEAIRIYQNGGTLTIQGDETSKALSVLKITSDGDSSGEGSFKYVCGASSDDAKTEQTVAASAWNSNSVFLYFAGNNVKYFKLTTTGTSKTERVYVKALTLDFVADAK